MTKRNKWHKKQLRIISKSYKVCRTVYISKSRRAANLAWHLQMAKNIFEMDVISITRKPSPSLSEALLTYARGKQKFTHVIFKPEKRTT